MISYNNSAPNAVNNVGQFGATEGSIGAYKSAAEYAADSKYWAILSQKNYNSVDEILKEVERLHAEGILLKEDIEQLKYDFENQNQILLGLIQQTGEAIDNTNTAIGEANAATDRANQAVQDVLTQLDKISNMSVVAITLPPGAPATGSFDNSTGVFSFGIPEGQPGKDGTISDIGDVAISTPVADDYGFFVDKDSGGLYRTSMSEIANLVPAVVSFNGRTGPVVPAAGDYTVSQVTGAAASGVNNDINQIRGLTTALSIPQGGTGATTVAGVRENLGINRVIQGGSYSDFLTANGPNRLRIQDNGAWGSSTGTGWVPLGVGQGGTGATTADAARTSLGLGLVSTESIVPITKGGTGSTSAESARLALGAAKSGDNSDITSMTNSVTFTQPVSVADAVDATNAVNLGQISSDQGAALIGSFPSVAALKALVDLSPFSDGDRVVVRSFLAGYNVGGGIFQWHPLATTADDGFSVIQPSSVTGAGRWVNIKRGRLIPEECGCIPNDPSFDNGLALNRWASQQHCIGSVGVFYKTTALIPSPPAYPQYIDAKGMRLMTTIADVNGVELPKDTTRRISIEGLESFVDYSLTATDRNKANGFYIAGSREVTLKNIRCEGWKNSGVWWFEVNNMTIDGFVGWRNDWDGTPLFSSGGDLVEWTNTAGLAMSCSITNFACFSDGSQSISVNSLSSGRNIVISNGRCFTYDATDFTPKTKANIKARHGITIGYNSNQEYGGGVKVSDVIIRDKGWTGVYRSGGFDGSIKYQPATISNVSVYDCGFGVNQDNIGAGILFGDIVDGDMINNCYVEGFANANNGAYKVQDSVGTGKLTIANCVDKSSAGHGVHVATESVNVMVIGHRSIEPAGAGILLEAKGGATLFGSHTIDGCRIERVTDGYGILLSNGVISANIKNNEIRGTSTNSTSNCAIRVNQNGQNVNLRGNQIYGFAYGLWYNTYVDTTTIFPWGNNQFFGCINAHRFARTTGTSNAKVEPNFYDGATTNRFSNGGVGTSNGTEEFKVNGVPVT